MVMEDWSGDRTPDMATRGDETLVLPRGAKYFNANLFLKYNLIRMNAIVCKGSERLHDKMTNFASKNQEWFCLKVGTPFFWFCLNIYSEANLTNAVILCFTEMEPKFQHAICRKWFKPYLNIRNKSRSFLSL
ncbi:hypothetical protein Droror1_Dr00005699 [Drosera rotundifolia]